MEFFCGKKTLSTALGFEPRSFDCRSTVLTTELHRRPTSPSPQEDLTLLKISEFLRVLLFLTVILTLKCIVGLSLFFKCSIYNNNNYRIIFDFYIGKFRI